MTTEIVYSTVYDKEIRNNLINSPIWKDAYKDDEIADVRKPLTEYTIKFDGLTPVQVTKIKRVKR